MLRDRLVGLTTSWRAVLGRSPSRFPGGDRRPARPAMNQAGACHLFADQRVDFPHARWSRFLLLFRIFSPSACDRGLVSPPAIASGQICPLESVAQCPGYGSELNADMGPVIVRTFP